jgi:hypothetical protein
MGSWLSKLGWQLISFKFLSFWVGIVLLVGTWLSLSNLFDSSVKTAELLYSKGYITKDGVTSIITHSQTILYDQALSHALIFFAAMFASIFAIKGVSYYTESKTTQAVLNKMNDDSSKEDLKKFLPKAGQ